jgi:hypothetical protein
LVSDSANWSLRAVNGISDGRRALSNRQTIGRDIFSRLHAIAKPPAAQANRPILRVMVNQLLSRLAPNFCEPNIPQAETRLSPVPGRQLQN